jgi:hypothetical protein
MGESIVEGCIKGWGSGVASRGLVGDNEGGLIEGDK